MGHGARGRRLNGQCQHKCHDAFNLSTGLCATCCTTNPNSLLGEGNPMANKKTILLAPHDDGFGAFSTMRALARALQAKVKNTDIALRLIFLSGRKFPQDLGQCQGKDTHFVKRDLLYEIARAPETGNVDPPGILEVLKRIWVEAPDWESGINWKCEAHPKAKCGLKWGNINLCISMGVPWLHRAARRHKIPSIELGDTCVSMILRGCLEEGRLLSPFANRVLDMVADYELMASEAWLLPFAAPSVYEAHFASGGVPVNWLPGLFGKREPKMKENARKLHDALSSDPWVCHRPLVGVHAGKTATWDPIKRQLGALGSSRKCAFVTAGRGLELYPLTLDKAGNPIEGKGKPLLPTPGSGRSPYTDRTTSLGAQDLCLTRGGISALEHIVACCPIAITEEPLHWLSHHQREALVRGGLCIPISLDALRRDPDQFCADLIQSKERTEQIKRRMAGIQAGADEWFADYVLQLL